MLSIFWLCKSCACASLALLDLGAPQRDRRCARGCARRSAVPAGRISARVAAKVTTPVDEEVVIPLAEGARSCRCRC